MCFLNDRFLLLLCCFLTSQVNATECQEFTIYDHDSQGQAIGIRVNQQTFENQVKDLVINEMTSATPRSTRLSFAGDSADGCHFSSIRAVKGGDWGWHVAWISNIKSAVFYARLDREAWVTSPPKMISKNVVQSISLTQGQESLILAIQHHDASAHRISIWQSDDEGKNWQITAP